MKNIIIVSSFLVAGVLLFVNNNTSTNTISSTEDKLSKETTQTQNQKIKIVDLDKATKQQITNQAKTLVEKSEKRISSTTEKSNLKKSLAKAKYKQEQIKRSQSIYRDMQAQKMYQQRYNEQKTRAIQRSQQIQRIATASIQRAKAQQKVNAMDASNIRRLNQEKMKKEIQKIKQLNLNEQS